MRVVTRVKVGQRLLIGGRSYSVTKIHPYIVEAIYTTIYGNLQTRCFSIGDLVVAGYEPIE